LRLERFREYLRLLARLRLGPHLQSKLDPSDIVQETIVRALKGREQFRGPQEALPAWLRQILTRVIIDELRKHELELDHQRSLEADLEQSSLRLEKWLAAEQSSPSERAMRHEMLLHLADALAGLPADERTALELRYLQEPPWPLAEIARHLGRPTAKAVSGLLERGLKKVREVLRAET
jgi:RNA polymerase sigma-70 factor (ECF subfamily)